MKTRREHDLLGELDIPADAYYGVQAYRSMQNFKITNRRLCDYPNIVKGMAITKEGAAEANFELGLLGENIYQAIVQACQEIRNGKLIDEFQVDMIQGGAGTSTNMVANEVIANRALEIMGKEKGDYSVCHPNNHVNLSQSTNDAYPTGANIGICLTNQKLIAELERLVASFRKKAQEMGDHIKMGRTQMQDAVPMTFYQEFEGYATSLEIEIEHIKKAEENLYTINMGATAIGTGIGSDPEYPGIVTKHLRRITGLDLKLAKNLVTATSDTSDYVTLSSSLKRLAVKLSKISNDLRLLSSGPRAGLQEIKLPAMQPGSSIMPGKVNPVIPEAMNQIAFYVVGNDLTVTMGAEAGQLELNVFEPVMVFSLLESIEMLTNGMEMLRTRCVDGIVGNYEHSKEMVYNNIGLVTALNSRLGYEKATDIAKEALETDSSVYDLVLKYELLPKEELDDLLKPENMTEPRKIR